MIIAHMLLDHDTKTLMAAIYNIMDSSGDYKIGKDELKYGFQKILGLQISERELDKIIYNVDLD